MKNTNKTLYAVAVYFNPLQWKSRKRLFEEFIPYMEFSGCKVFTVEIAFADKAFEVTEANNPWHLQLRTNEELWHKERGLNLGIAELIRLVPDCEYIATIDADVRFSNPLWVEQTINALQHFCVVQPFSEWQNLNPKHESMYKGESILKKFDSIGYHQEPALSLSQVGNGHPGLAWAWRRETLEQLGGLIDVCISGSGDTHMANALCGDPAFNYHARMSAGFRSHLERWAERCERYVNQNVGYVNGICTHYWHGKSELRGYEKRWDIVCFHKFDPTTDLYCSLNGLYKFSHQKPKLKTDIRRTMGERHEDSVDV